MIFLHFWKPYLALNLAYCLFKSNLFRNRNRRSYFSTFIYFPIGWLEFCQIQCLKHIRKTNRFQLFTLQNFWKWSFSITHFVTHWLTHFLRYTIFLNNFITIKDRRLKFRTLDLHIFQVFQTKWPLTFKVIKGHFKVI